MGTYKYMGYRNLLLGERDPKEEHLATMQRNLLDKKPYLIWHHVSPQAVLRKHIHPWKLRKYLRSRSNKNAIFKAMCNDGSSLIVEGIHFFDPGFVPCKDHRNYREQKKDFESWHQSKKELVNRLKQELDILSKLEHKNVVEYYGMDMGENDIFVFIESSSATRTSIYQYRPMEEIRVSILTRDILNGLACLHSNNLAHRELCCDNIFVQKDGSVKIGNISWIKRDGDHDRISYVIDEPEWQLAPEVLHEHCDRGPEADIWNLGTTVLKMLIGHRRSWPEYDRKTIRESIEKLLNVPKHLSDNARDFIRRCFEPDPSKRPSARELLLHPFVSWFEHRCLVSSLPEVIHQIDDSEDVGKF